MFWSYNLQNTVNCSIMPSLYRFLTSKNSIMRATTMYNFPIWLLRLKQLFYFCDFLNSMLVSFYSYTKIHGSDDANYIYVIENNLSQSFLKCGDILISLVTVFCALVLCYTKYRYVFYRYYSSHKDKDQSNARCIYRTNFLNRNDRRKQTTNSGLISKA